MKEAGVAPAGVMPIQTPITQERIEVSQSYRHALAKESFDTARCRFEYRDSVFKREARDRYVVVSDLGMDKVQIFRFDAETGKLSPPDPPFATVYPGGGPRHFAFAPNGKFAYLRVRQFNATVREVFAATPVSC